MTKNISSNISLFADDTILFHSSKCPLNLHRTLSSDLKTLESWAKTWFVHFNANKSQVMTISRKDNSHPPLYFANSPLSEAVSVKYLGLFFHRSLSWHHHILYLYNKAISRLNALRKITNLIPRFALYTLYRSCILPLLDYGDILYDNCSHSDTQLLESVQTTAAKIILGCFKTTSHKKILNDLNLFPLSKRRDIHVLSMFHKILHGYVPEYLKMLAPPTFHELSSISLRHNLNVIIPGAKLTFTLKSFFNKASKLWNNLPHEIQSNSSHSVFVSSVTSFYGLDTKGDLYHLHGSHPGSNSLLCMLRLGHSPLNTNCLNYRTCACGSIENELHLFLKCPLLIVPRRSMLRSVESLLTLSLIHI